MTFIIRPDVAQRLLAAQLVQNLAEFVECDPAVTATVLLTSKSKSTCTLRMFFSSI